MKKAASSAHDSNNNVSAFIFLKTMNILQSGVQVLYMYSSFFSHRTFKKEYSRIKMFKN